jgi:cyclic pyranopterin phosphate synthase
MSTQFPESIARRTGPRSLPLIDRRDPGLSVTPALGAAGKLQPTSVRISVTDRCDFACTYCRPSGTTATPTDAS